MTIHGSKGLQYPVVYLPTLWNRYTGREPAVPLFHDDEGRRCRDVGGPSTSHRESLRRHWREDAGESLRLLYVAMTRAQSQVVAWYAAAERNTPDSALHRMLFGRRPGMAPVPDAQALVDEDRLMGDPRRRGRTPAVRASRLATLTPPDPTPLERSTERLDVRSFTRPVDTTWRRTSYSSLSAASAAHAAALSEPEVVPDEDSEVSAEDLGDAAEAGSDRRVRPLTDGVAPGRGDLRLAGPRRPRARRPGGRRLPRRAAPAHRRAAGLVAGRARPRASSRTPWSRCATARSVRSPATARSASLGLPDRLRELDFEVPLAGGDTVAAPVDVRLGDLIPLLRRHLPEGDAVRVYADALEADPDLAAQSLRGYLTGSIDVVLRLDVDGRERFLTVDYKTNWLGPIDQPLTAHDYRPELLDEAMAHSDYPLQALLYTVVLHRFLRWRLPAYDPATHLGGVLYLYLRGMCGPETPQRRRAAVRRLLVAAAGGRSWRSCPTCSTGVVTR